MYNDVRFQTSAVV